MKSEAIKTILELIRQDSRISDYKVNVSKKESFELFFVKGRLETVRATDTCDRSVTVYVDHDGFRGDAMFPLYPSTTARQMQEKLDRAVQNALLIRNVPYTLPAAEERTFEIPSNLDARPIQELAEQIGDLVFRANTHTNGSLNSVEVFVNRCCVSVSNSQGLSKTQHYCTAMVEAIPTFNGDKESVELYEQYNFNALSEEALISEISGMMDAVQARYEAIRPDFSMTCPVLLHRQELVDLFGSFTADLNYATVYSHGNLFHKGDRVQQNPVGDSLTLSMKGRIEGCAASACFDSDGLSLDEVVLIRSGKVENYHGSNRFGQYLGEKPTGNLGCICVEPGSFRMERGKPYLEILAMSGLQVDFFNDYIGGEVRLAYYHDGEKRIPVTGISVSGKLREVLDHMSLSESTAVFDHYRGPDTVSLNCMKIF